MKISEKLDLLTKQLDQIIQLLSASNEKDGKHKPYIDDDVKVRVMRFVQYMIDNKQHFKMTATEIADRCGLETNMSTLIQVGRVINESGYPVNKRRSGEARHYIYKGK